MTCDDVQASIFLLQQATYSAVTALENTDVNIPSVIRDVNAAREYGNDLAALAECLANQSRAEIEDAKAQQAEAETKIQLATVLQAKAVIEIQAAKAEAQVAILQAKAAAETEARLRAEEEAKTQQTISQLLARARQGVLHIMLKRFLSLAELANNLVATITSPDLLQDLLTKLGAAGNAEEAEQCLRSVQAALA